MNIPELRDKLKYGDINRIAQISKLSSRFVRFVFAEQRNPNTDNGKKVIAIAMKFFEDREALEGKYRLLKV